MFVVLRIGVKFILLVCRMQSEDLQQPGIRGVAVTVGVAGLRSGVSADTYVHDPDEFREGLGRRIPPADGHLDPLLDRAAFKRAAAVARQGTHADGLAPSTLFLNVLKSLHPPSVRSWENTWKYPSCVIDVIDRFVSSRTVKVESVVRSSLERTPRSDACKKEKETCDLCARTSAVSTRKRTKAQAQRYQVSFEMPKSRQWLSRIATICEIRRREDAKLEW